MTREKAKGPSQRQLKVGELIRHALSDILTRGELMDEVVERHTITVPEVKMSPDLKLATAYVMPLGGSEVKEVVEHLQKHAKFFRGELAKRVELRYMPEIRFRKDASFETSQRIDAILASPEVTRDLDDD